MKHLFLFFFLALFGFLSFPASGSSSEKAVVNKTFQDKSAKALFAEIHLAIEEGKSATIISQPLRNPNNGKENGPFIVRAPDDLIQGSVLEFHDRYHAIQEIFDSKEEFKSRYSSIPPPRQYSLSRYLFRAIIAPNAP